jgi:hypothetical protein
VTPPTWKRRALLGLHAVIIVNFLVEIAYATWMIFSVLQPEGGGPLGARALELDHQWMVTRRLYAIECWIAIAGLCIYLAITEIGPRLREK